MAVVIIAAEFESKFFSSSSVLLDPSSSSHCHRRSYHHCHLPVQPCSEKGHHNQRLIPHNMNTGGPMPLVMSKLHNAHSMSFVCLLKPTLYEPPAATNPFLLKRHSQSTFSAVAYVFSFNNCKTC